MFGDLVKLQQASKADSTLSKYQSGWSRWREWALSKRGVPVIPARPLHIALFLTELCQSAEAKGLGCSSLVAAIYSIRWAHETAGIQDCPTNNPIVKSSLEGAKRRLSRPVQPKQPLTLDLVTKLCERYCCSSSLADIRFLFILLISYAGFFRVDELQKIRIEDVTLSAEHMSVRIPKRKNDQYREGHESFLARSGKMTCPVSITEKLLDLLKGSDPSSPLIRRIVKGKGKEYFHATQGISKSWIRQEFKKYLSPLVEDIKAFSMHSIKSGAASNPGCRNISNDLLDRHAGWRCQSSKYRYIQYSTNDLLKVTKALGI